MKQKTISVSEDLHETLVERKTSEFGTERVTFEEVIWDLIEEQE